MSAPLPVQRIPRPAMPEVYDQATIEAAFQALERDLVARFTRKADLAMEPGKRFVLASTGGNVQYALGLENDGKLTVTNYLTGVAGELIVNWEQVDGAAERDASIEALEAVAAGLDDTYATIVYVDSVESTLAGSIASSFFALETAYQTADGVISAAVAVNSGAISTINTNAAFYDIIVAAGGGDPARISLKAGAAGSVVMLDGDQIWFGGQTVFDTTKEAFVSVLGSTRHQIGFAPFGVGNALLRWAGPDSVTPGMETTANGYYAETVAGVFHYSGAALGWGATAAEAAASNSLVPTGQNMLIHPNFNVVFGLWEISSTVADTRSTGEASGIRYRQVVLNGTPAAGQNTIIGSAYTINCLALKAGDRVGVRALLGGFRMSTIRLAISWYNAAGTNFQDTVIQDITSVTLQGGGDVSTYHELSGVAVAPTNAVYAKFYVRGYANGSATPHLRLARPVMALLPPGQLTAPAWGIGFPAMPGADQTAHYGVSLNPRAPLSSSSTTSISVAATTVSRPFESFSLPSATITGLSPDTDYAIFRDLVTSVYVAVSSGIANYIAELNRYLPLGSQRTQVTSGVFSPPPPPPPGGGGGGSGGSGFDWTYVDP